MAQQFIFPQGVNLPPPMLWRRPGQPVATAPRPAVEQIPAEAAVRAFRPPSPSGKPAPNVQELTRAFQAEGLPLAHARLLALESYNNAVTADPKRSTSEVLTDTFLPGIEAFGQRNIAVPLRELGNVFQSREQVAEQEARLARVRGGVQQSTGTASDDEAWLASVFGGPGMAQGDSGGATAQIGGLLSAAMGALNAGTAGSTTTRAFPGQPMPAFPERPVDPTPMDFSAQNEIIAAMKPRDYDEAQRRKELALPTFLSAIAQGGLGTSEDAPVSTVLFRMGLGALTTGGRVQAIVDEERKEYDEKMLQWQRLSLEGKHREAAQRYTEGVAAADRAWGYELAEYEDAVKKAQVSLPQLSLGPDGSLTMQQYDPTTGVTNTLQYNTPNYLARANGLLSMAGALARAQGRDPNSDPDLRRRVLAATGMQPQAMMAADIVKSGLLAGGHMGIDAETYNEAFVQPIQQQLMARADLTPTAKAEEFETLLVNRVAASMFKDRETTLKTVNVYRNALKATGREPLGSLYKEYVRVPKGMKEVEDE